MLPAVFFAWKSAEDYDENASGGGGGGGGGADGKAMAEFFASKDGAASEVLRSGSTKGKAAAKAAAAAKTPCGLLAALGSGSFGWQQMLDVIELTVRPPARTRPCHYCS
eukprot:SAG22_NODE_74_length_22289_cov_65.265119_28_plen_109_part_00